MTKWCIFSAIWGVGGSMNLRDRSAFADSLAEFTDIQTPQIASTISLIDYEVRLED